jgi:hypothetical protein
MAANFQQHMGMAGQMMAQQPPQPNPQQQQQPQAARAPNGAASQIQYHIAQALKSQPPPRSGWQTTVPPQERLVLIFNMCVNHESPAPRVAGPSLLPTVVLTCF